MTSCKFMLGSFALLIAGCANSPDAESRAVGYRYHDGVHNNYVSSGVSQQALQNAQTGVWLWPPKDSSRWK